MIKSKQIEDTLRSESNPFDVVYADKTVGDLSGAVRFTALNNTGSTIGAYKVVYINGVSGSTPTIALADANNTSAMPAFGITVSAVTTGNQVDVITFGNLKGVDTSLLTVGTLLYVSATAGEYTSTAPTGSTSKLQNIGMVVKSHTNGIIKVGGAGRSAATPNLDQGKFFIGNASAQSSQSDYQLPATLTNTGVLVGNSDGSAVLSTDVLSIDTANNTVDLDDNVKVRLGTGNDFELFHDGTNSIIKDNAASGGSTIKYLAGTQTFQNKDANKTMAVFNAAGSIDLHHNGVKKFETTSSGVQTTGTLNLNNAYTLPTADGSANQVLATDGSGQLSFVDQAGGGGGGSAADDITVGDAAVTIATTAGDITIDAQGNDTDIIFKGTDNNADLEILRLDASNAGTATFSNDIKLQSDGCNIMMGTNNEVYIQHAHNAGLTFYLSSSETGNDEPRFRFQNSADTSRGPQIELLNNQGANYSDGDVCGSLEFFGNTINGSQLHAYSLLDGVMSDVTNFSGSFNFKVLKGGVATMATAMSVDGNTSGGSTVDITDHDGAAEGLKLGGTLVTSTAAEINFLDTSAKAPSSGDVLSYNGTSLAWTAQTGGGGGFTYSAKGASDSPVSAAAQYHYSVTGTTTITLPAASGVTAGQEVRVKNMGTNTVTVSRSSSDTIDGETSIAMAVQYQALSFISNGSDAWEII